jgi:hypothetical protein
MRRTWLRISSYHLRKAKHPPDLAAYFLDFGFTDGG